MGFSLGNHQAIGDHPWLWKPPFETQRLTWRVASTKESPPEPADGIAALRRTHCPCSRRRHFCPGNSGKIGRKAKLKSSRGRPTTWKQPKPPESFLSCFMNWYFRYFFNPWIFAGMPRWAKKPPCHDQRWGFSGDRTNLTSPTGWVSNSMTLLSTSGCTVGGTPFDYWTTLRMVSWIVLI